MLNKNSDECINYEDKELKSLDLIIEQQKLDDFFSNIISNLDLLNKSNGSESNYNTNINKKKINGIKEDCFDNEKLSTNHTEEIEPSTSEKEEKNKYNFNLNNFKESTLYHFIK